MREWVTRLWNHARVNETVCQHAIHMATQGHEEGV